MHNCNADGTEQSIDNGLETNQGPGLARHTNSPKNCKHCQKIDCFKCVSNQSNDIFAYADENSQFDRTDNNQSAAEVVPHRNSNIFFTQLSKSNMMEY